MQIRNASCASNLSNVEEYKSIIYIVKGCNFFHCIPNKWVGPYPVDVKYKKILPSRMEGSYCTSGYFHKSVWTCIKHAYWSSCGESHGNNNFCRSHRMIVPN